MVALSRKEALRYAEMMAGVNVGIATLLFIILLIITIFLMFRGEFLWAIVVAALMILAIIAIIIQSRFAEVYGEEQARVAAR